MNKIRNEFLWVEAYRPRTLDDIILTSTLKKKLQKWIEDGEIPNFLFCSNKPGTGKSSLAHVLIHSLGCEAKFINASLESNIDTLKSKVLQFASTASFDGRPKIVVLDEADGLNTNSTQPALRAFIEEFSKNVRFILTANTASKIIEPLRDRLEEIDFDEMFHNNKAELIVPIAKRSIEILKNENITYDVNDVKFLVKHYYPSTRSIVKKLQMYSTDGRLALDKGSIDSESNLNNIIQSVIDKDFKAMRQNITMVHDTSVIFSEMYKQIEMFPEAKQPPIIIAIAKYQAHDLLVRDKLVNVAAMCAEVQAIL